jgi:hypothetical protein
MNKILFNGLGMDTNKTDVGNYRIVSWFNNKQGLQCFIEISHIEENNTLYGTIRQAYKIDGEFKKHCYRRFDQMYDTKFLLTKENVINMVNHLFGSKFDSMETITRGDKRWSGILKPNLTV